MFFLFSLLLFFFFSFFYPRRIVSSLQWFPHLFLLCHPRYFLLLVLELPTIFANILFAMLLMCSSNYYMFVPSNMLYRVYLYPLCCICTISLCYEHDLFYSLLMLFSVCVSTVSNISLFLIASGLVSVVSVSVCDQTTALPILTLYPLSKNLLYNIVSLI